MSKVQGAGAVDTGSADGIGGWLARWEPENETFWRRTGSRIAWRTLILTTTTLILSLASWFVMSVLVVRLPAIGFKFDAMQLFWLAAMPGLAGGTLRVIHTFLIPIFGTRLVGAGVFYLVAVAINWWYYSRKGCERPS